MRSCSHVRQEIRQVIEVEEDGEVSPQAAKQSYPRVVLSVRATNPAKRFYERMGFVITGEIANRVGTPSLNMVVQLS